MGKLHNVRNMLCDELMSYDGKMVTLGSLDIIDKLAHAIKNIDKIIDHEEPVVETVVEDDRIHKLYAMMDETEDQSIRMDIQRLISKMHG